MGAIDVGAGAIDRPHACPIGTTYLDNNNLANGTGTITSFELWLIVLATSAKVGTFYDDGAPDFSPRDFETLGAVAQGSKQTFSGLDCDVATNDLAGFYSVDGQIVLDTIGHGGRYKFVGDGFGGKQTYTFFAGDALSIYGTGTTAVVLQPTGISSAEGFGTTQLNLKLEPSGIASIEAFGTPTILGGLTIISPPAIPSAEAFGSLTVSPGGVIVAPGGISSDELFGLPELNLFVTPSGIVTSEAFGMPKLNLKLILSGIASAEAFGNPTLGMFLVIRPSGLASVQAFGSPILIVILAKGSDMRLPPGIPGEVSIPSGRVSLPWE